MQQRTKIALVTVFLLVAVAITATAVSLSRGPSEIQRSKTLLAEDELPPVPLVERTTEEIALADVRTVTFQGFTQDLEFYRNEAYGCGLSGNYTFMVANPLNGNADDEAPLWVYLHGGGAGYFDEQGNYTAVKNQDENTWNHEETFQELIDIITVRITDKKDGTIEDNTKTRRLREGYRFLVLSMCDHDTYLGMGTPYPNNPNPNAQVNGLQATMSAIDYATANYPTTHVFLHGTSAGSIGAYAAGMSYASEGIALTGVISDLIPGIRKLIISDTLAGTPGFPDQAGWNSSLFDQKVGPWRYPSNQLTAEERFGAGFNMTPNLQVGGLDDPFCAGTFPPLDEAVADGFDNNCAWYAEPLRLVAERPDNSLQLVNLENTGHVPTNDPGIVNDMVDDFIQGALERNPEYPFRR